MKINRALRLVIPIEDNNGEIVHVHAASVSREVFERYFLVMSKAFATIYSQGLGVTVGPRIAAMTLRKAARDIGGEDAVQDVETGLIGEMKRLANVICKSPNGGFEPIPFQEAVNKGRIDDEEAAEVENALAFFSLGYCLHLKSEREAILSGAVSLWSASLTSLSASEFISSLKTSIKAATSGETIPGSSVPS